MPYDDDPYWMTRDELVVPKRKPPSYEKQGNVKQSQQSSIKVGCASERTHRAKEPSPLLKEYMEKMGIPIK